MVPRFFLCLFLEEKSLSACGILGYFRAISGLLVAKVLQIFSALYPLCHKGLRDFALLFFILNFQFNEQEMMNT